MAADRKRKPAKGDAGSTPSLDEERYRAVIETSADGFWIVDGEGRILEVNEAYIRRSGYSRSELLSMHIGQLEASEDAAETAAHVRKIIREGSDLFETLHRARDGTVWQVEVNASYWPIEGGRFFSFLRDISRRKRSESLIGRRLELSEIASRGTVDDLLRRALDTAELHTGSNIGFFHFVDDDQETLTLQSWSTNTLKMCSAAGTGKHYPISQGGVWSACIPVRKPVVHNDYASLAHREGLPGGHPAVMRLVVVPILRDGKIAAIAGVGNKTSDYEQEDVDVLLEIASLTMEIVARKHIEEKLRESRERFQALIENTSDWIWEVDERARYTYTSPRVRDVLGFDPEEIIGKTPFDLMPPGEARRVAGLFGALVDGRLPIAGLTNINLHKDGHPVVLETSGMPIVDEEGRFRGYRGIDRDITEREKAREKLVHMHGLMQYVISHAQSAIAVHDRDLRYIYVSDQYLKQYGVRERDVIGRHHYDVFPNLPQKWRDVHQRVLAGAVEGRDEDPYVRDDGTTDWTRWECRPWYESDGTIGGLIVYAEIITERKRREEALRRSEENYRTLFDSSTDGIFLLDLDGNFIDANRTAYERLGYTREEFLGMSIRQLDDPAFASRVPERLRQIREQGVAVFESGHLRKDGSTMPVEVNSRLLEFQGKTVYFSVIRDISERKHAEELLRASEEFNRGILDTVDEGFIVVDRDFRILTANRAYCDQVGATCDAVTGKHCYEVSHRTDRPCHEAGEDCTVQKVFASGKPHTALHRHPDVQGQMMFVETKAYPILDAAGHVASVIETITNVTERKLLEEERLKTQKLESIGTLAGGIAHDFNNLLQGVFGYISMAKMPLDRGDRSFAMLEQAEKALHLSVNLTNQLLTFSKGGKPVKKRVALGAGIANAALFALSGSRSVCRLEIDPGLWDAEADEGQIAQVIQNVALNADQAMPLGGTVTVTARNLAAAEAVAHPGLGPQDHVEIAVRDEGVGIPAQYLDKIFDPYFTTKEKGSGLGLATSYSIVKNHGGKIEVQSVSGAGSTFTIFLPAVAATAATAARPESPARARTARVLVMDDEEMVRTIAGELLVALGHEVDMAERGETALEKYRAAREAGRPFDIVILDLTIRGGMGGAETVRRLLEIDAGVKAVVSSGYSDDEVTSSFRKHGFCAFLKKPYRLEDLKATLGSLLT